MAPPEHSRERTSDTSAGRLVLPVLVCIAFLFWRVDFNFFWRDDWYFLDGMRAFGWRYLIDPHFGHVQPFYKLLFYLQLRLFGTNAIAYSYVNILFFALGNYAVFRLVRSLSSVSAAWITSLALTMHPLMFNHVGWTFEQCVSHQLLFQVLAVAAFLHWARGGEHRSLRWALVFTVVQNYFFGNGLFMPMLFAAASLVFPAVRPVRWKAAAGFGALFVLFVLVQLRFGGDRDDGALTLANIPAMLSGAWFLLGMDTSRYFFLREYIAGPITPWVSIAVFAAFILLAVLRRDRERVTALFLSGWFLVSFWSIPMVRQTKLLEQSVPHYYSVLCIIPVALLVEHALGGRRWWKMLPSRLLLPGAALAVLVLFLLDRQLMGMVSFRSFRNQQLMMKSLQDGTPYYGFDDPCFTSARYDVPDAVGVYAHWRDRDLLRSSMGYAGDPANWTRERSLHQP